MRSSGQNSGGDDTGSRTDFKRSCQEVWESDIRSDLIYQKGLLICQSCLGLFYPEDKTSTHPPEMTIPISRVCAEHNITTWEAFYNSIFAAAQLQSTNFGRLLVPRMSPQHIEPPKSSTTSSDQKGSWTKSRVNLLEQQVHKLECDKQKLETEKKTLESHLNTLIERLLEEKSKLSRIRLHAERHLVALDDLLHPQGCRCTGLCREEGQNMPK